MQRQRNALDTLSILALQLQSITAKGSLAMIAITVLHLLDISTGAESAAFAGNHQHRNCRSTIGPLNGGDNVIDQSGAGQSVAQVIACQCQHGNPVLKYQSCVL